MTSRDQIATRGRLEEVWCPTHQDDDQEAQEDPEDVAEDVHEDDGEEGDGQARLTPPLLALHTQQLS